MARVLVIDADPRVRRALADLLRPLGHVAELHPDERTAVAAVVGRPIGMVLASAGAGGALVGRTVGALEAAGLRAPLVWTGPVRATVEGDLAAGRGQEFLATPPTAPALAALVRRFLPAAVRDTWSGPAFLRAVDGEAARFAPARVLFLAHRLGATGVLRGEGWAIALRSGQVVGVSGVGGLLGGAPVLGADAPSLAAQIGAAISQGLGPTEAMEGAAVSLGALLCAPERFAGRVVWESDGPWPEPPLALGVPVPRLLMEGQRRVFPGAASRAAWAARRREAVEVRPPDDAPDAAWGLSPAALRLVRDGARADTLGDLVAAARGGETDEVWAQVHHLLVLGMLELRTAGAEGPPVAPPEDEIAVEVVSAGAAPAAPPDARVAELRAVVDALLAANAAERLEIRTAADATEDGLQRAFRSVSARYHPDRFHGAPPAVAELAGRAFSLVGEARDALLVGGRLNDLRERLKAQAEGRVFVSEDDRRRAKVKLTHAEAAAKKQAFVEAHALYTEAHRLDPLDWVAEAGLLRNGWKGGVVDGPVAAARLQELKPATPRERGDLLALAGEMLIRAGRPEEAYPLLDKAVQLCPDHIDARRHLRLRDLRNKPEEKSSLLDNLKGLFKPRGAAPAPAPAGEAADPGADGPAKR